MADGVGSRYSRSAFVLALATLVLVGCRGKEELVLTGPITIGTSETRIAVPYDECPYGKIAMPCLDVDVLVPDDEGEYPDGEGIVMKWGYGGQVVPVWPESRLLNSRCTQFFHTRTYYVDHWNATIGLPDAPGPETLILRSTTPTSVGPLAFVCLPHAMYGRH